MCVTGPNCFETNGALNRRQYRPSAVSRSVRGANFLISTRWYSAGSYSIALVPVARCFGRVEFHAATTAPRLEQLDTY